MRCNWCGSETAVTSINVGKGRRLQMVEACPDHVRMIEANREEERQRKEAAKAARLGPTR